MSPTITLRGAAVQMTGLEWAGMHHRGIDDARNLAALTRTLLARQVSQPST